MEIKNIFGNTIKVTDLDVAIKEANECLGYAWCERKSKEPKILYTEQEGKRVTLIAYHSHNLNALLELLPPIQYPEWCFVGGFPTCYCYCDKRTEERGDYKTILRLFYNPLRIETKEANKKKYPDILELAKEHLRRLQIRINEPLVTTASGQTTSLSLSTGPDIVIVKHQ